MIPTCAPGAARRIASTAQPCESRQVVRRGDRVGLARAARRVLTPRVPDPGVDPRLVVRRPVADAVAEPAHDRLGVLDEGLRGRAHRPAARVLERLRRVPVEERRERLDPCSSSASTSRS